MWLGKVPWAGRYWVLPAHTVLTPSSRYYRRRDAGKGIPPIIHGR